MKRSIQKNINDESMNERCVFMHIAITESAEFCMHLNDPNISYFFRKSNAIFPIIDKRDSIELLLQFYFNFIGNTAELGRIIQYGRIIHAKLDNLDLTISWTLYGR